jgi:hypothetical protein
MTLNCEYRPHVQSMILATDDIGMSILLDPSLALTASVDDYWGSSSDPVGLSACYNHHHKAVHAEIGTTALIRSQGYDVDVMMTAFHSETSIDEYCKVNSGSKDPLYTNGYFGTNVHPYETIFAKGNRNIDSVLLDRLTVWHTKMDDMN